MKQHKAINFNEVMKPSIDSGRFIANDGMIFFLTPKIIFTMYTRTFGIMTGDIDIDEAAVDCCVMLHKYDGEPVEDGVKFLSIIYRAISSVIQRHRYRKKRANIIIYDSDFSSVYDDESEKYSPTLLAADESFSEEKLIRKMDMQVVDRFIEKTFGKTFLTIMNKRYDGYKHTEIAGGRVDKDGRYRLPDIARRRTPKAIGDTIRFIQQNF